MLEMACKYSNSASCWQVLFLSTFLWKAFCLSSCQYNKYRKMCKKYIKRNWTYKQTWTRFVNKTIRKILWLGLIFNISLFLSLVEVAGISPLKWQSYYESRSGLCHTGPSWLLCEHKTWASGQSKERDDSKSVTLSCLTQNVELKSLLILNYWLKV